MPGLTLDSASVRNFLTDFSTTNTNTTGFDYTPVGGMDEYLADRGGLGSIKYNTQAGLVYNDATGQYEKPKPKNGGAAGGERGQMKPVFQYVIIALLLAFFTFLVYKLAKR